MALMQAPEPLLQRLQHTPGMEQGRRRLVLLLTQLGDFDSLEYAQALAPVLPQLEAAGISTHAIAIGDDAGADRFCAFTGFPRACLAVEREPHLHRELGLYAGLQTPGGPWPGLLLMCAGIGSPGTLAEVLRGYLGIAPRRSASPTTKRCRPVRCHRSAARCSAGPAGRASSARLSWPPCGCAT